MEPLREAATPHSRLACKRRAAHFGGTTPSPRPLKVTVLYYKNIKHMHARNNSSRVKSIKIQERVP
ncbi:MAG: hypothetical protein MJE68_25465 [Proteobacteria bacterium]|nr:hypothetical protein [Pseudomonadota bacterium]